MGVDKEVHSSAEVYLAAFGHGPSRHYEIALAIGDELVYIAPDTAHELAARLILLARIVDPEGVE